MRRIVDDYLIGVSPTAIAHELTADGVPAPRSGRWHATAITAILNSNRPHHRRYQRQAANPIHATWKHLISDDESALVQLGLLLPPLNSGRSSTSLLGGILRYRRCHQCLVARITRFGRRVYSCRTAATRCPGSALDTFQLDAHITTMAIKRFSQATHPRLPPAEELRQTAQVAREQFTSLAIGFGAGRVDHDAYLTARDPLDRLLS